MLLVIAITATVAKRMILKIIHSRRRLAELVGEPSSSVERGSETVGGKVVIGGGDDVGSTTVGRRLGVRLLLGSSDAAKMEGAVLGMMFDASSVGTLLGRAVGSFVVGATVGLVVGATVEGAAVVGLGVTGANVVGDNVLNTAGAFVGSGAEGSTTSNFPGGSVGGGTGCGGSGAAVMGAGAPPPSIEDPDNSVNPLS